MIPVIKNNTLPKLYTELASWWPILSAPEDYAEEAEIYRKAILEVSEFVPKTILELGCGGGNNASHLKKYFKMTLTDISPGMLEVSRKLNPECEHILGDMREIRLNRQFDTVFVHDAITYMITENDVRKVIETAFIHCRPGGVALFAPDHTKETYYDLTKHGGHDHLGRSLRYLEWNYDPDPDDTSYISEMVYLMRDETGEVCIERERHIMGLFSKETWLGLINTAGFEARIVPFDHSEFEPGTVYEFLGRKPIE